MTCLNSLSQEDIDLTMFQQLLKNASSRKVIDQNGLPIRVAFRGCQVVFRYQHPILPPTPASVVYRRFQLMFTTTADVSKFVASIRRVCQCTDHSDEAKATRKKKAPAASMHPPVFGSGNIPPSTHAYHTHHEVESSSDHYPPSSQRQLRPASPISVSSYRMPSSSPVESQPFFGPASAHPIPAMYLQEQGGISQGDRLGRRYTPASRAETRDPSPACFDPPWHASIMEEDSQYSQNDYADYGRSQRSSNSGQSLTDSTPGPTPVPSASTSKIDGPTTGLGARSGIYRDHTPTKMPTVTGSAPVKATDDPSVEDAFNAKPGQHSDARPPPTLVESISAALASTNNPLKSLSTSEMNRIIFEVVSGDGFAELLETVQAALKIPI
ncbi:hypothetical protein BS47DRAFT_1484288 [Hydnum rufescens UP504]|uniref:Uncharacterized protein n=1 Tax=Hydnum rufescens UP504 TaxID=1448309 RepID=A0A9P6B1S8_9AGAM|nr:hypothetical protein BS47DRAFT_1484288 [Hydnum rufescens UP504]